MDLREPITSILHADRRIFHFFSPFPNTAVGTLRGHLRKRGDGGSILTNLAFTYPSGAVGTTSAYWLSGAQSPKRGVVNWECPPGQSRGGFHINFRSSSTFLVRHSITASPSVSGKPCVEWVLATRTESQIDGQPTADNELKEKEVACHNSVLRCCPYKIILGRAKTLGKGP